MSSEMRPQKLGATPRHAICRTWPVPCPQSHHRLPSSFRAANKITTVATSSLPPPTHQKKKDTVIVISGPTGAGKSRLALEVRRRLGGEIISADSVQVYRGLDVGSAKPTAAEMSLVPHHLIDILDTSDDYSAGSFFCDARRATLDVLDRGCVPVVAGGTGLYLRWYIYGKPDVPQSSMDTTLAVWSELADFRETGQWEEAVELVVQAGDPKARDLFVNNWNRLSRSLEIIRSSGSPPSAFALPYDAFCEQHDADLIEAPSGAGSCRARELDYDFFYIFLASPRIELYRSIDLRCEEMLADTGGLLSEASWLLDIGLQPRMNSATSAIGYKQKPWSTYCTVGRTEAKAPLKSSLTFSPSFRGHLGTLQRGNLPGSAMTRFTTGSMAHNHLRRLFNLSAIQVWSLNHLKCKGKVACSKAVISKPIAQ